MNKMKERQRSTRPTDAIIHAVASVRDVDPVELERPLFEAIDPDALDRLFDSTTVSGLSVAFNYHGHHVEIRENQTVVVDGVVAESPR